MFTNKLRKKNNLIRLIAIALALIVISCFGFYMQYTSVTTYTGTLPCADCVGIKTTLTIQGNHTYQLSSLYIDRGNPFIEKGTWQQLEKNNMQVYQLKSGGVTSYYQIVNASTLKMLDTNAKPIDAPFSLELKKSN